jgi:hypothetical protein
MYLKEMWSMRKNKIDSFVKQGAQFDAVRYLIEFFPAPLPKDIVGISMRTKLDLIRMSGHMGFNELFYTDQDFVTCTSQGRQHKVSRFDFLSWQLQRSDTNFLYFLRDKVGANLSDILDFEAESENDPSYDPDAWLFPYNDEDGNLEKGLAFIERLRTEHPDVLYERLIQAMNDDTEGALCWFETEVDENVSAVRTKYKNWKVPLMVVSDGYFRPYLEAGCAANLKMDGFRLDQMWVRNYDEG